MKIAYLVVWDMGAETGVLTKIRDQVRAWEALGHRAGLFAFSDGLKPWSGLRGLELHVEKRGARWRRPAAMVSLAQRVARWNPDVVYLRMSTWKPGLDWLMRRVPTVLEINTLDAVEFKASMTPIEYRAHQLTRGHLMSLSVGAIPVTRELARRAVPEGLSRAVVANGADLKGTAPLRAPANTQPRLVFVGSPGFSWHGVDEIERLAALVPEWDVVLVGMGRGDLSARAPANVVPLGVLGADGVRAALASADVAVGTLALHRKGMVEACPLKVRAYLAAGLPLILGCEDTDFPKPVDFVLQVPNAPGGAASSLDEIRRFVASWMGHRVPRERVAHLDWTVKERARLAAVSGFLRGA